MAPARVLDAWTEITRRHVLLTSAVQFRDYYDIRFRCVLSTSSTAEG